MQSTFQREPSVDWRTNGNNAKCHFLFPVEVKQEEEVELVQADVQLTDWILWGLELSDLT